MSKKELFTDIQPEDELLQSEIAAIETDVQKELDREIKAAAKEKLREKLLKKARQKRGVEEPMVEVTIDLAPYADHIRIDNVVFMQGMTYTVRASVAAVMSEIMQRTWAHQSEIDGKSENFYRRARATQITPHGVINGSQLLKA